MKSIFLILISLNLFATDLELDCKDDGTLERFETKNSDSVFEALREGEAVNIADGNSLCRNIEDCLGHLGFISKLTNANMDVVKNMINSGKFDDLNLAKDSSEIKRSESELKNAMRDKAGLGIQEQNLANQIQMNSSQMLSIEVSIKESERKLNELNQELSQLDKPIKRMFNKKNILKLRENISSHTNELKAEKSTLNNINSKNRELNEELAVLQTSINIADDKILENQNDSIYFKQTLNAKIKSIEDLLATCNENEHADDLVNNNKLTIYYPYNGRGNNKTSRSYDYGSVKEIIKMAIFQGVDPYFALSIIMIENAPVAQSYGSWIDHDSYASSYGPVPVDAIAAYDIMGCVDHSADNIYNSDLITPKRVKSFKVGRGSTKKRFCSGDDSIGLAAAPYLEESSANASGCCVDVVGPADSDHKDVKSALGMQFLKNIQKNVERDQTKNSDKSKYFALGYSAQRYNGLGTFGASEYMENNCIMGVKMSERPVYGLLVQDLMVNSLMLNPAVKSIVEDASKSSGYDSKSMLCQAFGEGKVEVDSREFLSLQKDFLLNYEDSVSASNKTTERDRKKSCSKNGKVSYTAYSKDVSLSNIQD